MESRMPSSSSTISMSASTGYRFLFSAEPGNVTPG
jgi:hypothetical protein